MATQWDDILTVQEVQDAALGSTSTVDDNPDGVVEGAIRDAQDRIATYLSMDPIVHRRKESVALHDWIKDKTLDPTQHRAWASHQPVVEVESPSEVSVRHDSRQFLRQSPRPLTVDYFAGWKRSDQSLSDFNGTNSGTLTELGTEPSDLPGDIRRSVIALVLFELVDAEHGALIGQMQQAVGSAGTITVEGTDRTFVDRQLRRLEPYQVTRF